MERDTDARAWAVLPERLLMGGVELASPRAELTTDLAHAASLPGAVLPVDQEHMVTWLAGRSATQRSEQILVHAGS